MDGFNKQLSSLFDGLLESAVTCQYCNNCSTRRDKYMDLSLEISDKGIRTLHDALRHFTKTELLGTDNMVECSKCEKRRQVSKGLRLATAPTILVCHLKRFTHDKYGRISRVSKSIEFPLSLDISNCMSKVNRSTPPLYELVGVLVHQGQTCSNGHYISYVKSGDEWYRVSDNHVTQVEVDYVLQQKAYILMYEMNGMRNHKIPFSLSSGLSRTFSNTSTDNNNIYPNKQSLKPDSQLEKINSIVDPCEIFSFLCTNSCFGMNNNYNNPAVDHNSNPIIHRTMQDKANNNNKYTNKKLNNIDNGSHQTVTSSNKSPMSSHQRRNSASNLLQCESHHKEMMRRHHSKPDASTNKEKNNNRRARSLSRTRSGDNNNTASSMNQNVLSRSAHGFTCNPPINISNISSLQQNQQPSRRNAVSNFALPPRPVRTTSRTSY